MMQLLYTQGTGGTQVPYQRVIDKDPQRNALDPIESLRLKRYEEHWNFFLGMQWNIVREDSEPLIMANYSRAVVNKKATWLLGNGVVTDVKEPFKKSTLPILERVWTQNDQKKLLLQMATMGGITGDVFVVPTYQAPTPLEKQLNPFNVGTTRLRLVTSEQVFPAWDPLNTEKLLGVKIVTEVPFTNPMQQQRTQAGLAVVPRADSNVSTIRKRRFVEYITPEYIAEGWEGEAFVKRPNELGEVPLVHIQNESVPGEYYGLSDMDGVIDLQREFNEKMTDVSDVVHYHAAPITIIQGAKARNLQKNPKNLWAGLPTEAKIFNLEMGGDQGASHKYLELVRQILFDVSGLPEGSLGRLQSISNTSAAALEVQFQPLVEATSRKAVNYEQGLRKINYFILRIWEIINRKRLPVDMCEECGGRIVSYRVKRKDGSTELKKKCYRVDPVTMDLLSPDDVPVKVVVEHSFGNEIREMTWGQAKRFWGKKSPSYWDPAPQVDKQEEADSKKEHAEKQNEKAQADVETSKDRDAERDIKTKEAGKLAPKPATAEAKKPAEKPVTKPVVK